MACPFLNERRIIQRAEETFPTASRANQNIHERSLSIVNSPFSISLSLPRPLRPKYRTQFFRTQVHRVKLLEILDIELDDLAKLLQVTRFRFQSFPLQYGEQILLDQFIHDLFSLPRL